MKKATCRELRGACDAEIVGNTPEEMGENSKKHVMEMVQSGDQDHIQAIKTMGELTPEDFQKWHEEFKKNFDSLPEA